MNRRYFLPGAAAAAAALRPRPLAAAGDRVRVACVGIRGRGRSHISAYLGAANAELAALCDVDESVLKERAGEVEKRSGKRPALFTDFRKLLEDKSIDAVSIATPNHWHTLQTIWACQAGKDVYVEKPCSHNLFESQQIVAAARRYNRVVQHGSQSRSSEALRDGFARMSELIGDVYMARGLCFKWRDTIGRKPEEPEPAGVHYDLWLGPAPKRPFTRNRFHYNWHWFWDYGNGDIGNRGVHQMDVARWGLGVKYPVKVSSMGGHFMFDDDQQTPNTQVSTFEFNEGGRQRLLVFEVRHWLTNAEAGIGQGGGNNSIGNLFYGPKGYLAVNGGSYKTYLGKEQEPGPSPATGRGDHFANFLEAVRSRRTADLHAEIEEGATSCVLVHLANISYRLGRTVHFDPAKMQVTGDDQANRMFTRAYRSPYVVPGKV